MSDTYEIIVDTDYTNTVFEHIYENNNQRKKQLIITQLIPDLTVESLVVSSNTDFKRGRTIVNVSWSVRNVGKGNMFSKSWTDRATINLYGRLSYIITLGDISRTFQLKSGKTYAVYNLSYILPRLNVVKGFIQVKTDVTSNIYEENENNNVKMSQKLTLPPIYDKLDIVKWEITQSESNGSRGTIPTAFAGSTISVSWTVNNSKAYPTSSESWLDAVYLLSDEDQNMVQHLMKTTTRTSGLSGLRSYSQTATITLPKDIYGSYSLRIDIDKTNNLLWEAGVGRSSVRKVNIQVPPSPDLVISTLKYQPVSFLVQGGMHSIIVLWEVKNIGNSMQSVQKWSDEIVLSKIPGKPFAAGRLSLGSFNLEADLRADQTYTQRKTLMVPSTALGSYYVHVITDAGSAISERNGENNNVRFDDIVYFIPSPEKPDLKVGILSPPSTNVSAGDTIRLSYKVENIGGSTVASSWTEIVSIRTKSSEHILISKSHVGILNYDASYTVELSLSIPIFLESNIYDLFIVTDKYRTVQDTRRENNVVKMNGIVVRSLPKPDLQPMFSARNMTSRSGQPISVAYKISNNGPGQTFSGIPWFDTLFLSEDLVLDPFDIRLAVLERSQDSLPSSSFSNIVNANLPFDLTGKVYYLLLKADSGNHIKESKENNNIDSVLLNVLESYATDLAVSSVTVPSNVDYGGSITAQWTWTISNNGSKVADGYKCDSVYLSSDRQWDMKDSELKVDCGPLSLSGSGTPSSKKSFSIKTEIPLVSQAKYYSIVKTRSNIRDVNKGNNIGISNGTSLVQHKTLQVGLEYSVVLPNSGIGKVLRIASLPASETLIVKVFSKTSDSFVDVFVCYGMPATSEKFDVAAGQTLSPNQTAIISNTRQGDYYILVSKVGSEHGSASSVSSPRFTILAKIAKFEITSVQPMNAAPLGQVTLTVEGTLFPYDIDAHFFKTPSNLQLRPVSLYRYSSSKLFVTVNTKNLSTGEVYHLQLSNKITRNITVYLNALTIIRGLKGTLSTRVQSPRALRLGEAGLITVDIQNTGHTDVIFPMFEFFVGNTAVVYLTGDYSKKESGNQLTFVARASDVPVGVLPPGGVGRVSFNVKQRHSELGRVSIKLGAIKSSDSIENPYLKSRKAFQPAFYSNKRWDRVWSLFVKNVGKTTASLSRRLSKTAANLGMLRSKVVAVDDLIKFELNLADGFHTGKSIHQVVDVTLEGKSNSFPLLRLSRYFSPRVSYRAVKGPFGYGWIAPLL